MSSQASGTDSLLQSLFFGSWAGQDHFCLRFPFLTEKSTSFKPADNRLALTFSKTKHQMDRKSETHRPSPYSNSRPTNTLTRRKVREFNKHPQDVRLCKSYRTSFYPTSLHSIPTFPDSPEEFRFSRSPVYFSAVSKRICT